MAGARETLGRRSARAFSVLTLGRMASLLIGIASIVVIARMLGPDQLGVYTLAFAFYSLLWSASNFGFGVYLSKHLAEHADSRDSGRFSSALTVGFISVAALGAVLALAGAGASGYAASFFGVSGADSGIFALAAATIFFSMLYGTADYALIGMGKNAAAIAMEVGENIVLLASSILLISMHYYASGAIAGILVSYIVAGVAGTYFVFRVASREMGFRFRIPKRNDFEDAFRFSLPVAASNIVGSGGALLGFAPLLLGAFVSTAVLGNFQIASKASAAISLFCMTAANAILPTLSIALSRQRKGGKGSGVEEVYNKTMLYSMAATVPLIVYIGVFAGPLVYVFFSPSFGSAPLYLALMAMGTIIGLLGMYATTLFTAVGKTSRLFYYTSIAMVVQVVALLILTPFWKAEGNIFAVFFIGSVATDYLLIRDARITLKVRTRYGKLLRMFAANAALAAVLALGLLLPNLLVELAYGLVAAAAVYPPLLALSGAVDGEDVRLLSKAVGGLPGLGAVAGPAMWYLGFFVRRAEGVF
jgi:O-antigen/teichoic acid export membrane protein